MGIAFACALSMTSCGAKSRQASGDSGSAAVAVSVTDTASAIVPVYAKGYTVKYLPEMYAWWTYATLRKKRGILSGMPWFRRARNLPVSPDGYTVIETPVKHAICMTSLQLSNFIRLDACDYVAGITSTRHLFNKEMKERLKSGKTSKIGIEGNFDNEVIMSINPDVIFISPFKRGGYDAMRETGIPLVPHLGYKEMTPAGTGGMDKVHRHVHRPGSRGECRVCRDRETV